MKQLLTKKSALAALVVLGLIMVSAAFVQVARAEDNTTTLTWTLYGSHPTTGTCTFDQNNDGVLFWDDSELPHDFTTAAPGRGAGINIYPTDVSYIEIRTEDFNPDLRVDGQLLVSDSTIQVRNIVNGFILHKRDQSQALNEPFYALLQGAVLPNDPEYTPDPGFVFVYTWEIGCH